MASSPSASAERFPAAPPPVDRPECLISVDVEDWRDARLAGNAGGGDLPAPAVTRALHRMLGLFAARGARATFFVLARLARHHPALVRALARDHEVATHGMTHADLRGLDRAGLKAQIGDSRRLLEDLCGRPVRGYRSPNWSLGAALPWGAEVIAAEGLAWDSSLIPGRGLAFLPGAPVDRRPHRLAGTPVWEFPPTVVDLGVGSFPAAGGAFLRTLPAGVVLSILARARRRGETPHLHLHPWEFGADDGGLGPDGWRGRFLRAGAGGLPAKLDAVLTRFRGAAIGDHADALDARAA
ncbi:MAG TPA: polysaccharide deacetylase family protein [Dongiaceae bacterium]|nr:polysaccharide deacetylase family protein [Dongiaceae bacterium]